MTPKTSTYEFFIVGEDGMEFTHEVEAESTTEAWGIARSDYPDASSIHLKNPH